MYFNIYALDSGGNQMWGLSYEDISLIVGIGGLIVGVIGILVSLLTLSEPLQQFTVRLLGARVLTPRIRGISGYWISAY